MTKARIPVTFPNAITRIAGLITFEESARIVGRSDRCVRDWSDPSSTALPSLDQGLALDAAYHAAGGEGSPILETYTALLGQQIDAQSACRQTLCAEIASAAVEFGEAVETSLAVTLDGANDRAVQGALHEVEQAQTKLGTVLRRLQSFLPRGVGPNGGTTGGVPK